MVKKLEREMPLFSAKDLGAVAALSHRQLNVWETRGLFHAARKSEGGWRKFTVSEVLALMVCAKIRRNLGVPLQSLRWLLKTLTERPGRRSSLSPGPPPLPTKEPVYLLTDLKSILRIGPLSSFERIEELEFLRIDTPESFILINLTPLLKKLLKRLDLSRRNPALSPPEASHYLNFVWEDREKANG